MIDECNKEREKQAKEAKTPEKKIQNEAKHYGMRIKPEIKVKDVYKRQDYLLSYDYNFDGK